MKINYRNFRRLSDAGSISSGWDSALILVLLAAICGLLAYVARDIMIVSIFLAILALASLFAFSYELKHILSASTSEKDR